MVPSIAAIAASTESVSMSNSGEPTRASEPADSVFHAFVAVSSANETSNVGLAIATTPRFIC